ncbi:MAG: CHAT domain-containing protein [Candidatus Rokubacteria bacterium]|nr:CHAT domain-containing protein [Candidatus Rokubacteria bacterium]
MRPLDVLGAMQRGQGREALAFYEREAARLERAERSMDAAHAHNAAAFIAPRLGEYQRGIVAGTRALDLVGHAPRSREGMAVLVSASLSLGNAYRQVGDLARARGTFEAGLQAVETSPFRRRGVGWRGSLSRGLASVAYSQGDYSTAVEQGTRAIAVLEESIGAERAPRRKLNLRRHLAEAFLLVGNAQRQMGRFPEATAALRRALEVTDVPEARAQVAAALGQLARAQGDPALALQHFREALPEARRNGRVPLLVSLHHEMARIHAAERRFEEALTEYREAMRLVEDVRSELEEASFRTGYLENKLGIYHGAARSAVSLGRAEEAFGFAERARARAFLDLLGTHTTLSKGKTRALVEEEMRLRAQLAEARGASADSEEETEDETAPDPASRREQLRAAEAAYRAFLERVRYLVTDAETLVWVVTRGDAAVLRLQAPRRLLLDEVRAFRAAIAESAPLEQITARARQLHDRLVGPVRRLLHGERLLIVPHDVLHYLPFTALRSPRGRWLVEDYTLATLPSASVLKYLGDKGGGEARPVVVGNPDLGPALELRYAGREARAIGAHFPGARVLLRADATEARVKALAGEAGLLHFATHAQLDEQEPLASALLLAPDGADDGRLEVREIFGLDLHARLVVLSACETGLGQLSRGDELVGLQRAFLYAGTPAVITTLWKVDDRASFALMGKFYDQLQAVGPAQALRQAGRATLAEYPHPFAWAGFVLTGVPD